MYIMLNKKCKNLNNCWYLILLNKFKKYYVESEEGGTYLLKIRTVTF